MPAVRGMVSAKNTNHTFGPLQRGKARPNWAVQVKVWDPDQEQFLSLPRLNRLSNYTQIKVSLIVNSDKLKPRQSNLAISLSINCGSIKICEF